MAVATPVLERNELNEKRAFRPAVKITEEEHNARIKSAYAMLIDPKSNADQVLGRTSVLQQEYAQEREVAFAPAVEAPARVAPVPLQVQSARTNSAVFRADSYVNQRNMQSAAIVAEDNSSEEENEDLRPTQTTIQYRTKGVQASVEEGKITNFGAEKRMGLGKKEKIVIAVVVSVIVAILALIIINSAVISNINSEISSLQSSLTTVKATYNGVNEQINSVMQNVSEAFEEFVVNNNMIKVG